MKHDVIIIGAGLGGLVCGSILSRAGLDVLVLEREAQPGGCLQSYRRHGLSYDTGFHYVGGLDEGQSLHAAFSYLGLLRLPWHRLDTAFDRIRLQGRDFAFVQGGSRAFADALADVFPGERDALQRYAALMEEATLRQYDGLNPGKGPEDVLAAAYSDIGAWSYIEDNFRDPLLRQVLGGNALRMELRRESLPLFSFVHCNAGYTESSWRLRGDGSLIVGTLCENIRSYGGNVRCRAEVCELIEKDGRIVAVRCSDGEICEARTFISSVHPSITCGWLKESRVVKKVWRRRMAGLENTSGICTVSLRLRPQALEYFNCNHYVYNCPDVWSLPLSEGRVGGVLVSCRLPEDPADRCARQVDLLTPMSWEQCRPWADTVVGHRGEDYLALKGRLADECIALAEQSLPGLGRMVEECYVSTPLTWRDYTSTPEGSAYGMRKDYRDPLLTFLTPRMPVPNLLLTGQSLLLHGVHGVTMTSLFTCAALLGKDWVWQHIIRNK